MRGRAHTISVATPDSEHFSGTEPCDWTALQLAESRGRAGTRVDCAGASELRSTCSDEFQRQSLFLAPFGPLYE
jgi:hypothetical protein